MSSERSGTQTETRQTLLEQCEPLFQYHAWLHKLGRGGAVGPEVPDERAVRRELMRLFRKLREEASEEVYDELIERALWAFADGIVSECGLAWARAWDKRGFDPEGTDIANLDQEFWDHLEATVAERESEARLQRLEVFGACLGFGYDGAAEYLNVDVAQQAREIWTEIGDRFEEPGEKRITPQAYSGVNRDRLPWDPKAEVTRYLVVLACMLFVLIGAQVFLFYRAQSALSDSLDAIDMSLRPQPTLPDDQSPPNE